MKPTKLWCPHCRADCYHTAEECVFAPNPQPSDIENAAKIIAALEAENKRLRAGIDRVAYSLTDSIMRCGNDLQTNLQWVRKLAGLIKQSPVSR